MNKLVPSEIKQSGIQATLPHGFVGITPEETNDICENYHKGDPQSVAANRRVDKVSQRKRVLEAIRGLKGATSEEVENLTHLPHQSVSARMSELKRSGLIVKIGLRKTSSGCNAGVYKI